MASEIARRIGYGRLMGNRALVEGGIAIVFGLLNIALSSFYIDRDPRYRRYNRRFAKIAAKFVGAVFVVFGVGVLTGLLKLRP